MAMENTEELLNRIISALDRVQSQVESGVVSQRTNDLDVISQLQAELATDKKLNAELKATVAQLQKSPGIKDTLSDTNAEQLSVVEVNAEIQRLRQSNLQLQEIAAKLREANQELAGNSELINASLSAELEALRSERAADAAQLTIIINQLWPLLAGNEGDAE